MPDVKPSPTAGAIRLSVTRADQKGTRSVSVLVIVACIPGSLIDSRPATEACSHTTSRRLRNGLRPTRLNRKKLAYGQSWSTEPIMLKASRSSCGLHRPRLCAFAHAIILWRSISLFLQERNQAPTAGSRFDVVPGRKNMASKALIWKPWPSWSQTAIAANSGLVGYL